MQKLKNLIKFLWNDLYDKRSVLVVNIYNIITAAWLAFLIDDMYKHQHEEGLSYLFLLLITFYLSTFVYFVCHIVFSIEIKKNKKMKDNPIIKSKLYRVISILSLLIVCFNYLLFALSLVCYVFGQLFS